MDVIETLTNLRKRKKISAEALSEQIGTTRPTLNSYEKGDVSPPLDVLINWCMALGIQVGELFRETITDSSKGDEDIKDKESEFLSAQYFQDVSNYFQKCPTLEDKECIKEMVKTYVSFKLLKRR